MIKYHSILSSLTRRTKYAYFFLWVIILFLSYEYNFFHLVSGSGFAQFEKPAESLIIGRLVRSDKESSFSHGGLLGLNHPKKELCDTSMWENGTPPLNRFRGWGYSVPQYPGKFSFQFEALEKRLETSAYELYYSNPAGQAFLYTCLGRLLDIEGIGVFKMARVLNALFSALVLALFISWCLSSFGYFVSIFTGLGILLSCWLTLYGHNIFYILGLFYLPFISSLYFLKGNQDIDKIAIRHAVLMALAVFVKCLVSGFDFITVTLLMGFIPMCYYFVLHQYPLKAFIRLVLYSGLGASLGVVFALVVLAVQISADKGSLAEGMDYIFWTLERRSRGTSSGYDIHMVDQDISTFEVIMAYWHTLVFDFGHLKSMGYLQVRFREIGSVVFALSIVFLAVPLWFKNKESNKALFISLWISLLPPLSWLIIFKNHSQVHMHMNPVIWSMPFLLFAFAFIGLAIQKTSFYIAKITKRKSKK